MLVKHNLWDRPSNLAQIRVTNYDGHVSLEKIGDNLTGQLIQYYGLLLNTWTLPDEYLGKIITISYELYNVGDVPIYAQQQGMNQLPLDIMKVNPGEKKTISYTSKYEPIDVSRQLRFAIRDKGVFKFSCKKIQFVEGENTGVFLPYKEILPTNKQPLLPPEGEYKEIQPGN